MRNLLTLSRLLSGLLTLTLAAIVAYWVMQLLAPRPAIAPSGSLGEATNRSLNSAIAAFGVPGAAAPLAEVPSNIQIIGVAESGNSGVAIIAVDGKPALPYAVGAQLDETTRLVSALDGIVVLEQNGRRIEAKAPERPSLAILSSGQSRNRDTGKAPPSPAPRAYNLPPRPAPPPGTMSPPAFTPPVPPPPSAQPQVADPNQPQGMVPGQPGQPGMQGQPGMGGQPAQYGAPQMNPQFNPQAGENPQGMGAPGYPAPNQLQGNPGAFQAGMPQAVQPQ